MPVLLLLMLLPDIVTIALIVLDVRFIHQWLEWRNTYADDIAQRSLKYAIALTAFSLFGKFPVSWLVCKIRKNEDKPSQERSPETDRLQRQDGSVIHIEFEGNPQGQPILFIHGWNENLTAWYYEKKYFTKDHRIILIDLPGLGKSKGPDNHDYSLQKMALDLEAVIEYLNLKDLVLWGHSMGGMIILTYCTEIGKNVNQRIKGIILQHTTYTNPTKTSILSGLLTAIEKPVLYPICYIMIALWPLFWLNKWFSYLNGSMLLSTRFLTFAGTQTHAQLDFISRLSAMAPPNVFARGMLGMMRTYDVTNDLKTLTMPALIFGAEHDRLTILAASEFMNRNIPNSGLVVLTPAGHQGLVERHTETVAAAEAFMKKLE
ncbi:MAG: alpha/beta hydrolase [Mucilaginibacter sp.]|nr:alpha/beta hydrolase [Mucilaginibacter sp.]